MKLKLFILINKLCFNFISKDTYIHTPISNKAYNGIEFKFYVGELVSFAVSNGKI